MQTISARLQALRAQMAEADLAALIIPRADEYLGEYIPEHNERLRWVSGFTGSAGVVIMLRDTAAIFVDGRYTVQVRQQVSEKLFQILHLIDEPHVEWLAKQLEAGDRVGYDARECGLFHWSRTSMLKSSIVKCREFPDGSIKVPLEAGLKPPFSFLK